MFVISLQLGKLGIPARDTYGLRHDKYIVDKQTGAQRDIDQNIKHLRRIPYGTTKSMSDGSCNIVLTVWSTAIDSKSPGGQRL